MAFRNFKNEPLTTHEKILLVLGLLLIGISLVSAFLVPEPTVWQEKSFRVILSLGAAFLGAFIPGIIELSGNLGELFIRAGGATVFFVLVYVVA